MEPPYKKKPQNVLRIKEQTEQRCKIRYTVNAKRIKPTSSSLLDDPKFVSNQFFLSTLARLPTRPGFRPGTLEQRCGTGQ